MSFKFYLMLFAFYFVMGLYMYLPNPSSAGAVEYTDCISAEESEPPSLQ